MGVRFARGRTFGLGAAAIVACSAVGEEARLGTGSQTEVRLIEEVVTTAMKKGAAQSAQDVAVAVRVFAERALAERHVTDLQDLGFATPNVALDGVGTAKGIANFTIRGQGIAGSIPSIDPTVGVFVDGVYLGITYGVIVDMLDLEAVEILRGPQGVLFGRNVTGGAVLLRSRRPSGEPSAQATVRLETGPEWRFAGSFERPLVAETLAMRVSGSYRDDAGWFDNPGSATPGHGAEAAWVVRPVFTWQPADGMEVTVIHEQGRTHADGPASQNRHRLDGFDIFFDETGYADIAWRHLVIEAQRGGEAARNRFANVFGWRTVEHDSLTDTDSTGSAVFHTAADLAQEQISNEVRYSRLLAGGGEVTLGAYFFRQKLRHRELRYFRQNWGAPYGGDQEQYTGGLFLNADLHLGSAWALTIGGRYTVEEKDVRVATSGLGGCSAATDRCRFDFIDGDRWRSFTPKVGLRRWFDDAQLYAQYAKGFRSGGYNLRNTSPRGSPGPFDAEQQDSFEVGLKAEIARGHARLNLAAFRNEIDGMQRQVLSLDQTAGGVQITANTADGTIEGFEAELVAALGAAVTLSAFLGYADGRYDRVYYDLTGDGSTLGDERLDLPRLAPLTWGFEGAYARKFGGFGRIAVRLSLAYRDGSAFTDDNSGVLNAGRMLDASVRYSPSEALEFALYGRNLGNEARWEADVDLSALVESTFSPLREGRVVGLEMRLRR